MSLQESFDGAVKAVKELGKIESSDELLALYALYKQATEGDINRDKPSMFDFKGKAKHDTWSKMKGMPKEDAMMKYVCLVDDLGQRYHKSDPNAAAEVNKVVDSAIDNAFRGF